MIAKLVDHFHGQAPIEIVTRDGDLTALCHGRTGVTCKAKAPTSPDLIRLYKLTVGDRSDTITGIPGYGEKAWDGADKARLQRLVDKTLEGHLITKEDCAGTGAGTAAMNWLNGHHLELDAMRRVIEPLPMSDDEFNQALQRGVDNPAAREAVMTRYML